MFILLIKILLVILLLYPAIVGFYFGSVKPKILSKITYGSIAVLLAMTNMILVIATYTGGFVSDSWLTFIFFFIFEISLLISIIMHFIMIIKKNYMFRFSAIIAIVLGVSGVIFVISLAIFSQQDISAGEGIAFIDSLTCLIPVALATAFFVIAATDRNTFLYKRTITKVDIKNKK
ncbi:MAG: hypothetical protein A2Y17_08610 [Clostridiales bacterium GWF2_38_85]|nr:MAG: hypothetical protein A2Y17_08610 [Clostridiales bacterium GWF2_38_85]HBL83744.1 hypothetical protein [Clostridiales bacterium]